jgi:hypothetical protein
VGFTLYDDDFFLNREASARASALRIVPIAVRAWRPRHVVDVGCGEGVWAAAFEAMDVPTLGIDGEHVRRDRILTPRFLAWDLTRALPQLGRFDLCVCLEVAEHLPAEAADSFVASLADVSDRILFSAAVPGQGGTGHVNEQPHEYWIERFDRSGFVADGAWRERFAGDEDVAWWYRQNLIVFERRLERGDAAPDLRGRSRRRSPLAGARFPSAGSAPGSPSSASTSMRPATR